MIRGHNSSSIRLRQDYKSQQQVDFCNPYNKDSKYPLLIKKLVLNSLS
ncbi:hypothetical protein LLB_2686 [Legionella longbeachae D-4968]|nr:hypothetical protein LLB_2686 [Legionella longbeachae D-4968]